MKMRPIHIIYFLVVYLPLEEFIVKWLPVSDHVFLWARQLPDALVLLVLIWAAGNHQRFRFRVPRIGGLADYALVLFIATTIISALINHADPAAAAVNIKALLRYVTLVYTLLALRPTPNEVQRLFHLLLLSVGLQVAIGVIQLLGGVNVRDFLGGRNTLQTLMGFQTRFTGTRYEGVNDLMGTMGNTINFAMFLLVGLAVWMVRHRGRLLRFWSGVFVLLWLILLTGSRSAFLVAFLLVAFHQFAHYPRHSTVVSISVLAAFSMVFTQAPVLQQLSNLSNFDFAFMFTPEYVEMAKHQRLGVLLYVLPMWLHGPHFLFGYGPDKSVFIQAFIDSSFRLMAPDSLAGSLSGVIEDVYWGALLVYYGIVGVFLFLTFYFSVARRVYRFVRFPNLSVLQQIGEVSWLLILASLLLNMLNQAFEIRQFSFYLWLFIGLSIYFQRQCQHTPGGIAAAARHTIPSNA